VGLDADTLAGMQGGRNIKNGASGQPGKPLAPTLRRSGPQLFPPAAGNFTPTI
jgi:hypothetical protein